MNLSKNQAAIMHRVKSSLAGLFVLAMIFGAVCLTLDMMDQAAVHGIRTCWTR